MTHYYLTNKYMHGKWKRISVQSRWENLTFENLPSDIEVKETSGIVTTVYSVISDNRTCGL